MGGIGALVIALCLFGLGFVTINGGSAAMKYVERDVRMTCRHDVYAPLLKKLDCPGYESIKDKCQGDCKDMYIKYDTEFKTNERCTFIEETCSAIASDKASE